MSVPQSSDNQPAPATPHQAVRMRPDLVAMQGYKSPSAPLELLSEQLGRPVGDIIKLDTNENPYGPPPRAITALRGLEQEVAVYPDIFSTKLREGLATYTGVPAEHILCGAGSDDIITLVARLFLTPDTAIIDCPPTFSVYRLNADWIGARTVSIPRREDFSIDVAAIEQAAHEHNVRLLFLCTPNNPDGSLIDQADILRLLELPLVVVVDEAYIEFTDQPSLATRVPDTPNLIVLRTFSKWAGLAGLRVGYGIAPLDIIQHLWKIKQPFNVSATADAAARACLDDRAVLDKRTRLIVAERQRLSAGLAALPYLKPYPSHANFVLAKVDGYDVPWLVGQLRQRGILIRHYDKPGLRGFIRITVGRPEQNDAVLAALRTIGEEHA